MSRYGTTAESHSVCELPIPPHVAHTESRVHCSICDPPQAVWASNDCERISKTCRRLIDQKWLTCVDQANRGRFRPKLHGQALAEVPAIRERSINRRHVYTQQAASNTYQQVLEKWNKSGAEPAALSAAAAAVVQTWSTFMLPLSPWMRMYTCRRLIDLSDLFRENVCSTCDQREIYQSPACVYTTDSI